MLEIRGYQFPRLDKKNMNDIIKTVEIVENILNYLCLVMFCIFLYSSFFKRPKAFKKKKKQKKSTQHYETPYNEYIESIWEELKKK